MRTCNQDGTCEHVNRTSASLVRSYSALIFLHVSTVLNRASCRLGPRCKVGFTQRTGLKATCGMAASMEWFIDVKKSFHLL